MKHLQSVADKVLDCIESTVDTWEVGASDKQNIRQITGALKDLQDIQSADGTENTENQIKLILENAEDYIQ